MTPWVIVAGVLAVLVFASRAVTLGAASDETSGGSNDDAFVGPIDEAPIMNADSPSRATSDANVSQGVRDLADAIAHAEGYGIPGAIPTRANNPGDLVMPNWRGGSLGAERISMFQTAEQGWAALYHQLQLIERGKSHVYASDMTLGEMADHWTSTQKPEWARNVADWLASHGYPETTSNTTLDEVFAV